MSASLGNLMAWWRDLLVRRRRLVLACVVVCAGASGAVGYLTPPRYVAHAGVAMLDARLLTTFQVSSSADTSEEVRAALLSAPQSALQGSPQLAASYLASRRLTLVALVENETVAEAVLHRLGRNATEAERAPGALLDAVRATLKRGEGGDRDFTNVIEIAVQGSDPVRAAMIANLWAEEYVELVNRTLGPCADAPALRERLKAARAEVDAAEAALATYHAQSRMDELVRRRSEVASVLDALRGGRAAEIASAGRASDVDALLDAIDRQFAPVSRLAKAIAAQESQAREVAAAIVREEATLRRLTDERDRAHAAFTAIASRLAKLPSESELSAGEVRILAKAAVPRTPMPPTGVHTLLLGTLAGLLLGIGFAWVREAIACASDATPGPLGAADALERGPQRAASVEAPAACP